MNDLIKLLKAFAHIKYDDSNHSYLNLITNKKQISVTQFLSLLKPKFNEDFWATKKANERNISKEELLEEWRFLKELGNSRGSYLHLWLENLNKKEITEIPYDKCCTDLILNKIKEEQNTIDIWKDTPITDSLKSLKQLAFAFKETESYLIPIVSEFIIGDNDLNISGKFDQLYYNEKTNKFEIWDYKTDKKLEYFNKYGNKLKIFNVDDCEYEKYSLQTSLYKYIIEKNTDIKLGNCNIVYFIYKENRYEIIECKDYTDLIKEHGNNWTTYLKP